MNIMHHRGQKTLKREVFCGSEAISIPVIRAFSLVHRPNEITSIQLKLM